jgi:uncharacterized protein YueI
VNFYVKGLIIMADITYKDCEGYRKEIFDKLDKQNNEITDIKVILARQTAIQEKQIEIEKQNSDRTTALENVPKKRWEALLGTLIGAVITIIIAVIYDGIKK